MNRKLAIFGFSIVWIATIVAILFVMLPKLSTPKELDKANVAASKKTGISKDTTTLSSAEEDDSFFYDKKVFVRHRKSETDTTVAIDEKIILVRKNIFFKPPPQIVTKPVVIKEKLKKMENTDFDIKPVPTN
jgi:hypothetical protein